MKHIIAAIALRLLGARLAANDAPEALLANAADGGSPFAILQQDGFVIPYGEFPHKHGLQLFDKAAAEEMIAAQNSVFSKIARWARGDKHSYPVYIGHPDLPGSKDTDKRAYGWIEEMSAENDGLHLKVKWSPAGRDLVENAHYKFYSPLWYFKKVRGGIKPVALKSMGLTNDPNIPVPALANEYDEEKPDTEEQPETEGKPENAENPEGEASPESDETPPPAPAPAELIAALGLAEDATMDAALEAIRTLRQSADAAATRATDAENERDGLRTDLTAANTRATDLAARLRSAAANAVQTAVSAGRIAPAEVEGRITELVAANDFDAALADLAKLPAKFKTESRTGDLGGAKSLVVIAANDESAAARDERARLVANEFEATNPTLSLGERKRIAWRRAQAKKPELFTKGSSGSAA